MRAVPRILDGDPEAQIIVVGGDGVSYGLSTPDGRTWRETMLEEIGAVDKSRLHMLAPLPHGEYLNLLRVSRAHVYLTVPFVLSWSCIEALATRCVVIGSDTPPVAEVIEHGLNGLLVDFFSPAAIADAVLSALRGEQEHLRARARETVLDRYSLDVCLPRQIAAVRDLA
jgi:glycosyltransferase involved in cell wall biosynthesis